MFKRFLLIISLFIWVTGCDIVVLNSKKDYLEHNKIQSEKIPDVIIDHTPPVLLQISPANHMDGILEGTPVILTFSEPMDPESVEKAFSIDPAGSKAPEFSWNGDHTVVYIDAGITYPLVSNASITSPPFTMSLSQDAADSHGNLLSGPVSSEFSMLKKVRTQIGVYSNYKSGLIEYGSSTQYIFIGAGDSKNNKEYRGFMSYNISVLPDNIEQFNSAFLYCEIEDIIGNPFAAFGDLYLHHVTFNEIGTSAFSKTKLRNIGVCMASVPTPKKGDAILMDLLTAVKEDYQFRTSRGGFSQYRLQYNNGNNYSDNDNALDICYIQDLVRNYISIEYIIK